VVATDAEAKEKFRRYWARFSPGIILIRRMLLRGLKARVGKDGRCGDTGHRE